MVETLANGSLLKILVIDLGTARRFASGQAARSNTITGTDFFMAPEVFGGNYRMDKVDSYSVGRTILVSALGYYPGARNGTFIDLWDDDKVREKNKGNPLVETAFEMTKPEPSVRWSLPKALNSLPEAFPKGMKFPELHREEIKTATILSLKQSKMGWVEAFLMNDSTQPTQTDSDVSAKNTMKALRATAAAQAQLSIAVKYLEASTGMAESDEELPGVAAAASDDLDDIDV